MSAIEIIVTVFIGISTILMGTSLGIIFLIQKTQTKFVTKVEGILDPKDKYSHVSRLDRHSDEIKQLKNLRVLEELVNQDPEIISLMRSFLSTTESVVKAVRAKRSDEYTTRIIREK